MWVLGALVAAAGTAVYIELGSVSRADLPTKLLLLLKS
jgi:hypothetical protein